MSGYNRIKNTLRYKLVRFISSLIKVDRKHNDYSYELGQLIYLLESYKEEDLKISQIVNTKAKRVGIQNSNYVSLVSNTLITQRTIADRVARIQSKLYLGLAYGNDLFLEMSECLTVVRSLVSTIEYTHEMHEPVEDTSRDTTESSESTSTQVRQVPTPGN